MAATDIKYFTLENLNAPQLQNAYGCMINVLDACLVTGLTLPQVAGITFTDGIATISFNTEHKLKQYQVIEISGANVAELNTQHRLLSVTSTTATFKTSVTSASGTFIAKLPALGWEKAFGSTNANGGGKAAYRSNNTLLPSRPFLRVVDELDPVYTSTYAKYAKVGLVEEMTDIDTMLGVQAPYDAALPNKNWVGTGSGAAAINGWAKWYYARIANFTENSADTYTPTEGGRQWVVIGNSDYFYLLPATNTTTAVTVCYGFGAFDSLLSADGACNFLSATVQYGGVNTAYFREMFTPFSADYGSRMLFIQRAYNQAAISTQALCTSLKAQQNDIHTGYSNYIGAASLGAGIPLVPVFINEAVLRGQVKNLYWLYQLKPYNHKQIFTQNDCAYMALNIATLSANTGQIVLKIGDLNAS